MKEKIKRRVKALTGISFSEYTKRSQKAELVRARVLYSVIAADAGFLQWEIAKDLNVERSAIAYYNRIAMRDKLIWELLDQPCNEKNEPALFAAWYTGEPYAHMKAKYEEFKKQAA